MQAYLVLLKKDLKICSSRETKPAANVRFYAGREERVRTKPGLCTSVLEPESVFETKHNYLQHHITAFSANKFKNHCIQDRDVLQHCKGAKNCSLMLQQLQATELLEIPGGSTFHAGHPSDCLLRCLALLMHLQVYTSVFRVRPVNFPLNGMFIPQISIMTNQTAHKSSLYEGLICHGVCTNIQPSTHTLTRRIYRFISSYCFKLHCFNNVPAAAFYHDQLPDPSSSFTTPLANLKFIHLDSC